MSDIIIAQQNLSRFTKRLKKSLEKNLGQEIPLNIAALIFAETLGVDSIHHLQQKIVQKPQDDIGEIFDFIHHYFKNSLDTKILSFYLNKDEMGLNIYMQGNTDKYFAEVFAIYFGEKTTNIDKYCSEFNFTIEDKEFLKTLLDKMYFNNIPQNIYLSERIQEKLHIKDKVRAKYAFKQNTNFKHISNYGYCHNLFAVIDDGFFERKELPKKFDRITSVDNRFVDFAGEDVRLYETIEDALYNLQNQQLLIEFKTPIEQTPIEQISTMYPDSEYKKQGLSGFYIHKKDNKCVAQSMNHPIKCNINNVSDYYYFMGRNKKDVSYFPINHPYTKDIQKGIQFQENMKVEDAKIKLK